ncbi:conjugal transfer protein TraF [Desulforhopalus sp. IMCC35007]|uniref:conjugal transfer protein TraF n=1 Tax=Desulforhopalus sp. IMCC35007 TaxID=2569543 RepID=UPI0010AE260C|nr:conjugal transfer protein TraF [Desulforhopalus sp. IMCC35007]TKB11282.1 conjugal transfer protein TraF [Desulforhopalus sp. IMCC35007]
MQIRFYTKPCHSGNHLALITVCLALILLSGTGASATDNNFYQDTKHGWFWYENPPPEPDEPEIKSEPAVKPRIIPSLDNYTIDDLWNLHPDDFQQLLNDLQKKAVQTPEEQNIMEYLTMQDIARRKALAYTNATMYVTQKYGDLFNVNQVYPAAGPGITARVQMQQTEIAQTINQAGANHALIFFVSPGCGFCEQQTHILSYFVDKYGWQIKTVNISTDLNAATRFNITTSPTLLLIKKGQDDYMTVANGVITLTELERKLYRAIRFMQGDTKGDNFLMYQFQKGSAFDPTSILHKGEQPWQKQKTP